MSSDAVIHKRNLESSILFMQQEHATILKGLHLEIAQLQKKCTDLTFQLTMNGLTIDEPGTADTQMQEVQNELKTSRSRISTLEAELKERDKRVEKLEAEARTQRKRWLDESRSQSQTMNTLRAELEAKSNNIAYLTTELHRLKQKGKGEQAAGDPGESSRGPVKSGQVMNTGAMSQPGYLNPESSQHGRPSLSHGHHVPTPPTKARTLGPSSATARMHRSNNSSRQTGHVNRKSNEALHPASADANLGGRKHKPLRVGSGRSSGSESPDITPFLPAPKEEFVTIVGAKQAPILPPITAATATAVNLGNGSHQVLVHKVVSSTSQHRQKAEAAIVNLAVENAVPDTAWSMARESRSTEFN